MATTETTEEGQKAFDKAKAAAVANVNQLLKENYRLLQDVLLKTKNLKENPSDSEFNQMAKEAILGIPNKDERGFTVKTKDNADLFITFQELDNLANENPELKSYLKDNNAESFIQLVPTEPQINKLASAIRDAVSEEDSGLNYIKNAAGGGVTYLLGSKEKGEDNKYLPAANAIKTKTLENLRKLRKEDATFVSLLSEQNIFIISDSVYNEVLAQNEKENDTKKPNSNDIYQPDISKFQIKPVADAIKENAIETAKEQIFNNAEKAVEEKINKGIEDEIKQKKKDWGWFSWIIDLFSSFFKPSDDEVTAISQKVAETVSKTLTSSETYKGKTIPQMLEEEKTAPKEHNDLSVLVKEQVLKELNDNYSKYSSFSEDNILKIAEEAGLAIEDPEIIKEMVARIPTSIYNKPKSQSAAK